LPRCAETTPYSARHSRTQTSPRARLYGRSSVLPLLPRVFRLCRNAHAGRCEQSRRAHIGFLYSRHV